MVLEQQNLKKKIITTIQACSRSTKFITLYLTELMSAMLCSYLHISIHH